MMTPKYHTIVSPILCLNIAIAAHGAILFQHLDPLFLDLLRDISQTDAWKTLKTC
jgi:hypothetical protein